jgi:hypothetical protein
MYYLIVILFFIPVAYEYRKSIQLLICYVKTCTDDPQ